MLEEVSVLLWASLLVLAAPVSGPVATVHKSVISVQPPWTTVFRGERVNLTCNGFHFYAQEKLKGYRWFSGKARPRETPGNTLEVRDSGQYRCQAPGSLPSNPVHLIFSSASLILQVPYSVFEGDELVLRCQKRGREKLAVVKYTWNQKIISGSDESLDLLIPKASLNNSGCYQCIAFLENAYVLRASQANVQIQELFSRPKLEVTDSQPIEGNPVNLTCGTRLPLERPDTPLRFGFFREDGAVISNWSGSPDLQITAMWREDSGSYWCGAETVTGGIRKRSLPLQIDVQRIPVSGVFLETQPQEDQVVEGETLVLVCSVAKGTGKTTFSWHREDTRETLGQKSQRSQRAELEIPVIWESHAGHYYCTADNGYGLIQSEAVNVTVRSIPGIKIGLVAGGTTGGSLSILLAVALLFYCWHQRKPEIFVSQSLGPASCIPMTPLSTGDDSQGGTIRRPLTVGPSEPLNPLHPAPVELQQLYINVHPRERDLVYSEIQITQPGAEGEANTFRTSLEDQHVSIVYSEVKTQL
ncbi:Fc receptor-like protein 4 isoform X1 [Cervus elaphus]|uniref:Fc receptor-like protein 4 isoform X1 n=1 Tax=Cervus canadensis TaxID=1574408 RepID=UPI001C9E8643|nr:Fc receptor-like protein 4 isoform X1 [Cervus canadensis]XP_043733272.1 Fc receptor-like protein 4 isoform X1 [Cervus elaphus]